MSKSNFKLYLLQVIKQKLVKVVHGALGNHYGCVDQP